MSPRSPRLRAMSLRVSASTYASMHTSFLGFFGLAMPFAALFRVKYVALYPSVIGTPPCQS